MNSEQDQNNSIEEFIIEGSKFLADFSETARLDAEILLCFVRSCKRENLIRIRSEKLSSDLIIKYQQLLERRKNFEPIAYLTQVKEFWGLDFKVNPSVLIPRPETETLIEQALKTLSLKPDPISILDLGTGSGAIIISLAHELKKNSREFSCVALDNSSDALTVAKENAKTYTFIDQIHFVESHWFNNLKTCNQQFDLIIANPPYIALNDTRVSKSTSYEPKSALYAGNDGLDAYREIFKDLLPYLKKSGVFISEIGFDQKEALTTLANQYFKSSKVSVLHFIKIYPGMIG